MEFRNYRTAEQGRFLACLGEVLINWNILEAGMKFLLTTVVGGGNKTVILTANLNSVGIKDTLVAIANEIAAPDVKPHLLHLSEFFDRLREHRNWHVHSIWFLHQEKKTRKVIGYAESTSARTRLVRRQKETEESELRELLRWLHEAEDYLMAIQTAIDGIFERPPLSAAHKPTLPARIQKPAPLITHAPHP